MRQKIWSFSSGDKIAVQCSMHGKNVIFNSMDGFSYCADKKTGKDIWRFATGDWILVPPVVHEDIVLIASFDNFVYCLKAEDGKEIWRFKGKAEFCNDDPFPVKDGIAYVPCFDNNIYAIDISSGKEIWRFSCGKYGMTGSPEIHNGRIYQGTRDGALFCIDLSGRELWRFNTDAVIVRVYPYRGAIYFGNENGDFFLP